MLSGVKTYHFRSSYVYLVMYNTKVMKATLLVPLHGNNLSSQTTTVVLFGVLSCYFLSDG
jgi:hypothetical protein